MDNSVEARINSLLREVVPRRLHLGAFGEEMSLRVDLAIDSLGLMSLAFRIEEEFSLDLADHVEEVASVQTVGDVLGFVDRLRCGEGVASEPVAANA